MSSVSDLKRIKKSVETMNIDNLRNVYSIINNNNELITRKSDCFLINLGNLRSNTINELINFIDFLDNNTKLLEEDELIKQEYARELLHDDNLDNDNLDDDNEDNEDNLDDEEDNLDDEEDNDEEDN